MKTTLLAAVAIVTALPAYAYCARDQYGRVSAYCQEQFQNYNPPNPYAAQTRTVCQIEGGGFAPQRMVCHQEY